MDFKQLREECVNALCYLGDRVQESSWLWFLRERYNALAVNYRRALRWCGGTLLVGLLFYYPVVSLYQSHRQMSGFLNRRALIQELAYLSASRQGPREGVGGQEVDLKNLITRGLRRMNVPEGQVLSVREEDVGTAITSVSNWSDSVRTRTVYVELDNLNLSEIVRYGYELEALSGHLKMGGLDIQENPERDNYFKVAYRFRFFTLGGSGGGGVKRPAAAPRSPHGNRGVRKPPSSGGRGVVVPGPEVRRRGGPGKNTPRALKGVGGQ